MKQHLVLLPKSAMYRKGRATKCVSTFLLTLTYSYASFTPSQAHIHSHSVTQAHIQWWDGWSKSENRGFSGWPPTDWASTRTRPSSFGLGRDTACPSSRAWVQLCNWVHTLSQLATRYRYFSYNQFRLRRCSGVTISADLSLDRHVSVVSATSFHSLRQLRRVRCSLDT